MGLGLNQGNAEWIAVSIEALSLFWQYRGRYGGGLESLDRALESLRIGETVPHREAVAKVQVERAWFCIRLGKLDEARAAVEECRRIHDELGTPFLEGLTTHPLLALGILGLVDGDYEAADRFGREALDLNVTQGREPSAGLALYVLSCADLALGDFEQAREHGLRAYEVARTNGDRWFMAYCLLQLGHAARALDDDGSAEEYYLASHDIRREFEDPEGMAVALNGLADLALRKRDYAAATEKYRRSLVIYREINDQGGLATSLRGLGEAACATTGGRQAAPYFLEALQTARGIGFVPLSLAILTGVGELLSANERRARGVEALLLARDHPASENETAAKAREILARHEPEAATATTTSDARKKASRAFEDVLARAEAELIAFQEHAEASSVEESLIEPLTPREREVLDRIAGGMSNREIANELIVSIGTAKAHTSSICGKLGVDNRVQAISRARALALLAPA